MKVDKEMLEDAIRGARNLLKQAKVNNKKYDNSYSRKRVANIRKRLSVYGEMLNKGEFK